VLLSDGGDLWRCPGRCGTRGAMRPRERPKETGGGGLMRRLVSAAGGTGVYKLPGVFLQAGTPEPLSKDVLSHLEPRMAAQPGGVGP